MSTLQYFFEMGEKSGLTGAELRNWAKLEFSEQQKRDKEERQLQATREKEERQERLASEKETKQLQMALERELKEKEMAIRQNEIVLERERMEARERELTVEREKIAAEKEKLIMEMQLKEKQLAFDKERLATETLWKDKEVEGNIKVKTLEMERGAEIEREKMLAKQNDPVKKYQGLFRNFQQGDSVSSWLTNFEVLVKYYKVPEKDVPILFHRHLALEPLKVIELIPEDLRTNYKYMRDRVLSHFSLDESGLRTKFKTLTPKSNQTFLDFASEMSSSFDKWCKAADINDSYEKVRDLIIRDRMLSAIPEPMSVFLMENKCKSLSEMETKGESYFNAHRDIFANCTQPELVIGASAKFQRDIKLIPKWCRNIRCESSGYGEDISTAAYNSKYRDAETTTDTDDSENERIALRTDPDSKRDVSSYGKLASGQTDRVLVGDSLELDISLYDRKVGKAKRRIPREREKDTSKKKDVCLVESGTQKQQTAEASLEKARSLMKSESSCQVGDKLSQLRSMKLIAVQQEITNKNKALHQVRQAIAAASLEAEITDFLHCHVIERRVDMVNRLCTDLDMVLNNMNMLLHRFHKPFVGDHIRMDAAYHKCAKDVFSQLVPTLNDLVVHMNNITWAANSDFLSSQLEPLLAEIQSLTASVQMSCHVLSQMNKGVERLSAHTHEGSTKLDITQDSMQSGPSRATHTAIHHRNTWSSAHKTKLT